MKKNNTPRQKSDTINKTSKNNIKGKIPFDFDTNNWYLKEFKSKIPSSWSDSERKRFDRFVEQEIAVLLVYRRNMKYLFSLTELQADSLLLNKVFAIPQTIIAESKALDRNTTQSGIARAVGKAIVKLEDSRCVKQYLKQLVLFEANNQLLTKFRKFLSQLQSERSLSKTVRVSNETQEEL